MNLSNQDVQLAQAMFVSSATQQHPLGTRGFTADGRVYRYVKAGASDLVAGNVIQSPALLTGNLASAVNTTSAVSAGSVAISLTVASSAAANLYAEGYACISTGTGQGLFLEVNSHPAVTAAGTGVFTLYGEDALPTAITTTTKIGLIQNKYNGVIQFPVTTATGVVVGVAPYIITASQFGWVQTWGYCACLIDVTPALGAMLNAVAATAGRAAVFTAASLLTGQLLGIMAQVGVAGEFDVVDLRVSP